MRDVVDAWALGPIMRGVVDAWAFGLLRGAGVLGFSGFMRRVRGLGSRGLDGVNWGGAEVAEDYLDDLGAVLGQLFVAYAGDRF